MSKLLLSSDHLKIVNVPKRTVRAHLRGLRRGKRDYSPSIQILRIAALDSDSQTALSRYRRVSFFQFDEAVRILHGESVLDLRERERWKETEPGLKRATRFLIELICMQSNRAAPKVSDAEAVFALESALICAESMVNRTHL